MTSKTLRPGHFTDMMEEILQSPSAQKITTYISPIYGESYVGLWLLESIGRELDRLDLWTAEIEKQLLPSTATWGLYYYALNYGIHANPELLGVKPGIPEKKLSREITSLIKETRCAVLEKISERAPFNPPLLRKILRGLIQSVGEITTKEHIEKHIFEVIVNIIRDVPDLSDAMRFLRMAIPAHVLLILNAWMQFQFYNRNRFGFPKDFAALQMLYRISNTGAILINGSHSLDKSWKLNQKIRGISFPEFKIKAMIQAMPYTKFAFADLCAQTRFITPQSASLSNLRIHSRVSNTGAILINGSNELDESWQLNQVNSGNRITGSLVITKYFLNGSILMDGSRKFYESIIKEEL